MNDQSIVAGEHMRNEDGGSERIREIDERIRDESDSDDDDDDDDDDESDE